MSVLYAFGYPVLFYCNILRVQRIICILNCTSVAQIVPGTLGGRKVGDEGERKRHASPKLNDTGRRKSRCLHFPLIHVGGSKRLPNSPALGSSFSIPELDMSAKRKGWGLPACASFLLGPSMTESTPQRGTEQTQLEKSIVPQPTQQLRRSSLALPRLCTLEKVS